MLGQTLHSSVLAPEDFKTFIDSVYIFGTLDERSSFSERVAREFNIELVEVLESQDGSSFQLTRTGELMPKMMASYFQVCSRVKGRKIFLDITGLSYSVWAPLTKALLQSGEQFQIVYTEPQKYTKGSDGDGNDLYDLSEKIMGISPIPGFASVGAEVEDFSFVALLGFEGTRFAFMLENVQPVKGKIFPIIGVPGFQVEYPFYTYYGNRIPLSLTRSWQNVKYVPAYCPYSLYDELGKIKAKFSTSPLKVALVGTKPHALGAVLFKLANPDGVELVYDHPIRKPDSSTGSTKRRVFDVLSFLADININLPILSDSRRR